METAERFRSVRLRGRRPSAREARRCLVHVRQRATTSERRNCPHRDKNDFGARSADYEVDVFDHREYARKALVAPYEPRPRKKNPGCALEECAALRAATTFCSNPALRECNRLFRRERNFPCHA